MALTWLSLEQESRCGKPGLLQGAQVEGRPQDRDKIRAVVTDAKGGKKKSKHGGGVGQISNFTLGGT